MAWLALRSRVDSAAEYRAMAERESDAKIAKVYSNLTNTNGGVPRYLTDGTCRIRLTVRRPRQKKIFF